MAMASEPSQFILCIKPNLYQMRPIDGVISFDAAIVERQLSNWNILGLCRQEAARLSKTPAMYYKSGSRPLHHKSNKQRLKSFDIGPRSDHHQAHGSVSDALMMDSAYSFHEEHSHSLVNQEQMDQVRKKVHDCWREINLLSGRYRISYDDNLRQLHSV